MSGQTAANADGYQWGRTENIEVLVKTTEAEARAVPGVSNFTNIAVRPPIEAAGRNDEIYCHLTGFNIPYSWYNTDDDNNKVNSVLTVANVSTGFSEVYSENFVLDEGNYTILSLANVLQTKINEAFKSTTLFPIYHQSNNVCSITYSTDTNKLTFHIDFSLISTPGLKVTVQFLMAPPATQQAYRQLGLARANYMFSATRDTTPVTQDLVSVYQCNMFMSNYIVIHTNFLTSNATTTNQSIAEGSSDILAMVPIMTPPFTFLTLDKTSTNVSHTRIRQKTISNISVRITDENNRELDFNGTQWNIGLAFEIVTEAGQQGHAGNHIDLRSIRSTTPASTNKRKRKK